MTTEVDSLFEKQFTAFLGDQKGGDDPPAEGQEEKTEGVTREEQQAPEPEKKEPTLAERAKALGWNPDKDEFESKTGKEWSTAGQFLRQRDMADEIHRRGQEAKQLRRDLDMLKKTVTEKFDNMTKSEQDARLSQLANSIKQAAIDQDFDQLDVLIGERDKLLKTEPVAQADQSDDDSSDMPYVESKEEVARVVEKWKAENRWFEKSTPKIQDEARRFEVEYQSMFENPSVADSLAYAAQKMLEKYPVLAAHSVRLKAPDTTPRQADRPKSAGTYTVSQLDDVSRGLFNSMKNRGFFKSAADEQAFLKDALGG